MDQSSASFLVSLGCLAVLILILGLLSSIIQNWIRDQGGQTDDKERSTQEEKAASEQLEAERLVSGTLVNRVDAVASAIHAYREKRDSYQRASEKSEKITIVVLGVTALFAFLAAGAAIVSAWIFNGQLEEMRLDKRPWVKIQEIAFNGPLVFDENGAHFTIDLTIRNVGHSPALHIWFEKDAGPFTEDVEIAKGQKKLCESRRNKRVGADGPGFVLFPDDMMKQPLRVNIRKADIDKALQSPIPGFKGAFPIYFFGCVDYAFSFAGGHHQTPFVHEIDKFVGPNVWDFDHFGAEDKIIPATQLLLLTNPMISGHTD